MSHVSAPRIPGLRMIRPLNALARRGGVADAIARGEPLDTDEQRGACWLARRIDSPERVRVKRFCPPELGKADWAERWASVEAALRAQIAAPSPFAGRVYALERDDLGAWCSVSAWVDGDRWSGHRWVMAGWHMGDVLSVLHDTAQAMAWARALRVEATAGVPAREGVQCPWRTSNARLTPSGAAVMCALDQTPDAHTRGMRGACPPEVLQGALWSSAASVFVLGRCAQRLLTSAGRSTRWPVPRDPRRPALVALAERCCAPAPEQRPSPSEAAAAIGALRGGASAHMGQMGVSDALVWLRGRCSDRLSGPPDVVRLGVDVHVRAGVLGRAHAMGVRPFQAAAIEAASSLVNLRPDLAQHREVCDYIWHHLGDAMLTPVRRGIAPPDAWLELMRWLPDALPTLDHLTRTEDARPVALAEAVRLLAVLGEDDPQTLDRLRRAQRDSPARFARQRARTLAQRVAQRAQAPQAPEIDDDAPVTSDPDQPGVCLGAWVCYRAQRWWLEVGQALTLGSAPDADVVHSAWPERLFALHVFPTSLVCAVKDSARYATFYPRDDDAYTFHGGLHVAASMRDGCVWLELSDVADASV